MCGIAGIIGQIETPDVETRLGAMNAAIAHRGPDNAGSLIAPGAALGHLRLSIIDLSESANQPMADASNRFIITFNGEIYNFAEVRSKLPDYPFRTDSDTETILAAFSRFGPDCLSMFNGMFAFAIWDRERREVFLARDRLGVKPLYYAISGGLLVFASEIRSILASGLVERRLSPAALRDYAMFQSVYAPLTIVEGIRQLPAGAFARFAGGDLEISPYWRPEGNPAPIEEKTAAGVRGRVRELLFRSVERRMISDVRLGAFLSGGIDSSVIVGLMAETANGPVNTFSVTFDERQYDESEHSEAVSRRFRTEHTTVRLGVKDFLEELPDALRAADSPSGDGVNTYVVSKATRAAGLKVALSGVGGDELFAGYPNFLNWLRFRNGALSKLPRPLRRLAGAAFSLSPQSKHHRMASVLAAASDDIATFYPLTRQVLSEEVVDALAPGVKRPPTIASDLEERGAAIAGFPLLSQFSIAELVGYTQNVLLKDADQFSMASALEVREPYFDFELVEYVLRIPDEFKYPLYPKSLLVESVAPMLPDSIVHRPKMGFVLPWEDWLRGDLRAFGAERMRALAERGIYSGERLMGLWRDFEKGRGGVLWSHVWHFAVLSDWLDNNGF